jgi:hypothetical protein
MKNKKITKNDVSLIMKQFEKQFKNRLLFIEGEDIKKIKKIKKKIEDF